MAVLLPPPLTGGSPPEVPLAQSPLVRVIAQVLFPPSFAIRQKGDKMADFQEALRADYSLLREEHVQRLVVESEGYPRIEKDVVWRFYDRTRHWRVSLGDGFVALDTDKYTSRTDFLHRLGILLTAVEETFDPQVALRVGLRYVDQMAGEILDDLGRLMRPEVVGVATAPLGGVAQQLLTEALLPVEEGLLQARWGLLPANATVDPNLLEPTGERSWIIDLDMFSLDEQPFAADELGVVTSMFAERIYTVFRWIVTDDFLKLYGGTP